MPTNHYRLSIVLTDEQRDLLKALAALQGRSAASYVSDLLDTFTPTLRGLLGPLQAAKAASDGLEGAAKKAAASLASGIRHPFLVDEGRQMDMIRDFLTADFVSGEPGEADRDSGPSALEPGAHPPSSNHGGQDDPTPPARGAQSDQSTGVRRG